jgi:hypothetical protein
LWRKSAEEIRILLYVSGLTKSDCWGVAGSNSREEFERKRLMALVDHVHETEPLAGHFRGELFVM